MASIAGSLNLSLSTSNPPSLPIKKNHSFLNNLKRQKKTQFPLFNQNQTFCPNHSKIPYATSPKGFGPAPKKKKQKPQKLDNEEIDSDEEEEEEEEAEASVIPEIVTNRMISRMGFSVGIPLMIGIMFFPFFYYLKVGLKIDVPTWVPFLVSFFFYGSALLGVSYGIVSSSWDPMREGSILGWNEAKKNFPVFWQSFWGGSRSRKK